MADRTDDLDDANGMDDTDDTPDETIDALDAPIADFARLCDVYLPTVAARIWAACCWPASMEDGWKMGDFRFVVFSVSPEPRTSLYVQFWSEPRERVLMEVSSGEWSPASVKYVQAPQRALLKSLGFAMGGEVKNFRKHIRVGDVGAAEEAARDTLRVLFDAFGFRGQWPLEIRAESGERAEPDYVYNSVTPDDLAKLLAEHGCSSSVNVDEDGDPLLLVQRGRQRFTVTFDWQVPDQQLYAVAVLDALVPSQVPLNEPTLTRVSQDLVGLTVTTHDAETVRLSMPLRFAGGVTADWVVAGLEQWFGSLSRCRRMLRRAGSRKLKVKASRARPTSIH